MKKGFIIPTIFLIALAVLITVISWKFYFSKQSHSSKDLEISQLQEQIKVLKEDRDAKKLQDPNTVPLVENIYLLDKSNIKTENSYKLDCWQYESIPNSSLVNELKTKLTSDESIFDLCLSQTLNKAVFFTYKVTKNGDSITKQDEFMKVYDIKTGQIKTVKSFPRIGGGPGPGPSSNYIFLWSKTNDIYYKIPPFEAPGVPTALLEKVYRIHLDNI